MRENDMEEFPRRLILRRWCKDAKCHERAAQEPCADPERAFRMRYGFLWSACMSICFMVAQELNLFDKAWKDLARMARELEELFPWMQQWRSGRKRNIDCDILDPKIVSSKGAPKARGKGQPLRRCKRCNGIGHDRRNCTVTDKGGEEGISDEECGEEHNVRDRATKGIDKPTSSEREVSSIMLS
ncbi:hypothetical protein PIB30_089512 [Stylosanthes scabra]|uniref:CCHC-type domain-containing protein n=1 Tax=Stylosanthes scabra TaxID=79078 RepID=A0ABU6XWK2_9FABA|nr:hypothetical protein [Stylosanthes scabra]